MCYQLDVHAYLVVVMDTQYYNGKYHVYDDYPIGDMLHMIGLANRPGKDQDGKYYTTSKCISFSKMCSYVSVFQERIL